MQINANYLISLHSIRPTELRGLCHGAFWHFVVLHEQTYAVHTGLNAADEELLNIFGVLKNTKTIIGEWSRKGGVG